MAGAAAAGTAMAAVSMATATEVPSSNVPSQWDDEADVVIVGYGGAGATASIAVCEAGDSVIVLEKAPEDFGGNTGTSSGAAHTAAFADPDEWISIVKHGCYGTVTDEFVEAVIPQALATPDWLDSVGVHMNWVETDEGVTDPTRPSWYKKGFVSGRDGAEGRYLFEELNEVARSWGADVRLGTPAKRLVQDPQTKEILGVIAENADGDSLAFKARKAVILACGGYENNPWMQGQFNNPGIRLFPWGTPYNTGDGFELVSTLGAQLWHMHGLEFSAINFKVPSLEANCSISTNASDGIQPYNHIFVNQDGLRFMNETKSMNHDIEPKPSLDFDASTSEYKNLPFYMVFDQTMFDAAPLWIGSGRTGIVNTYAGVYNATHDDSICDWGGDNTKALENGWIFKGETLEELAAAMKGTRPCGDEVVGVDAENLQATIEAFNQQCADGNDDEFGRAAAKCAPLDNPPYYAIELGFSCINTQGGPRRDEHCRTMNYANEPIARLYNIGEFGSINGYVYVCGNIFEALWTGRIAGQHAVTLEPWD